MNVASYPHALGYFKKKFIYLHLPSIHAAARVRDKQIQKKTTSSFRQGQSTMTITKCRNADVVSYDRCRPNDPVFGCWFVLVGCTRIPTRGEYPDRHP